MHSLSPGHCQDHLQTLWSPGEIVQIEPLKSEVAGREVEGQSFLGARTELWAFQPQGRRSDPESGVGGMHGCGPSLRIVNELRSFHSTLVSRHDINLDR